MSLVYSGSPSVHTSAIYSTKAALITAIQTALTSAGWTVVSGSGTTDVKLQSATTPQNLACRVRVWDAGANCVQVSLRNITETKVPAAGLYLFPSGQTWHIIANKYQFWVMTPAPSAAREFAAGGVPYLPAFIVPSTTECIWAIGNTQGDADTAIKDTFRTMLSGVHNGNAQGKFFGLYNGVMCDFAASASVTVGYPRLLGLYGTASDVGQLQWPEQSYLLSAPAIAWSPTGVNTGQARLMGYLWDAALINTALLGDTIQTFDGKSWMVVTHNNAGFSGGVNGINNFAGALMVVVP